jgi:hypothetical protein
VVGPSIDTSAAAVVAIVTTAVAYRVALFNASVFKFAGAASPVKQNGGNEADEKDGTEANKAYCGIIITVVGNGGGFGNGRSKAALKLPAAAAAATARGSVGFSLQPASLRGVGFSLRGVGFSLFSAVTLALGTLGLSTLGLFAVLSSSRHEERKEES